ncbi:MAG: hypothetical protein ACRYFV_04245 [Janthinobacterium lividum]
MSKLLLLGASFACLPLISLAQTASVSSHFYVGVGADLLTNVPFNSASIPHLVGPALTAGLQLNARLALQLGVAYHWTNDSYTNPTFDSGTGGIAGTVTNTDHYKYFTVPVLLRYTFTPSAEGFHVDGLAGVSLLHTRYRYTYFATFPSIPLSYSNEITSSVTRASLTLGPAVRYTLSPAVELVANSLVNVGLTGANSFSDRLFLNVLVGAQYTFGR